MSFGGYAAPFVQGSTSVKDAVHRFGIVSYLLGGVIAGAAVLWGILLGLSYLLIELNATEHRTVLAPCFAAVLFAVDFRSVRLNRLCLLSWRRQAVKAIMYQSYSSRLVGFVWGFDVGLGVTTYRVTSGVWFLSVLVVFGFVSSWTVFVFAGVFCCGLLTVAGVPARRDGEQKAEDAALHRLRKLGERRRSVQVVYLVATPVVLVPFFLAG